MFNKGKSNAYSFGKLNSTFEYMLNAFKKHINQDLTFLKKSKLLIAISGGLDSVVLVHLCYKLKFNMALAHCNFNLRDKESDEDERFVLQLAEDLKLETFTQSFSTKSYAQNNKLSIQMAARELRYNWFQDLAKQLQFDYILTAHHADDNLETFLINLSRGTGIDGLTGIPQINNNIVRPLLQFSREEIENYAKKNNLKWREDNSNTSTKYLRNKLRHDVIPILKEINPTLLKNFQQTQSYLSHSKQIIEDTVSKTQKKVVSVKDNIIKFNIKRLEKLSNPKAYLYELLKDFGFTQWNDLENLLNAQSGKQIFSKTHRLIKDRKHLLLTQIEHNIILDLNDDFLLVNKDDNKIKTSLGNLYLKRVDQVNNLNTKAIYLDESKLQFPLKIRPWRKGDYFYPLGMTGKKKISKYFKDEKLSLIEKENALLMCSVNDIVWVLNRRTDNRFKVTDKTKQILEIKLKK